MSTLDVTATTHLESKNVASDPRSDVEMKTPTQSVQTGEELLDEQREKSYQNVPTPQTKLMGNEVPNEGEDYQALNSEETMYDELGELPQDLFNIVLELEKDIL